MTKTTAYGGYTPRLEELKVGDVLLFGSHLTFNSKEIQELAKNKAIKHYFDEHKQRAGVEIIKPYIPSGSISPTQLHNEIRK